ncbi:MAG: Arm DNA-binding domain-containing protein, partial [Paracoccus sp. (in: a-proteobacteria)]
MPKTKLTAASIRDLPYPSRGQVLYLDTALPGLGIRVTPGAKTWFCEATVLGRNRRVSLGPFTTYTPDDARRE